MGKVFSFAFWVKIAAKSNQGFLLIFLIEIKYYLDRESLHCIQKSPLTLQKAIE